jgi:hypothetical protein
MISMLVSTSVRSVVIEDYKIAIYWFAAKDTELISKSKG